MNDITKNFVELVQERAPNIWRTAYPRRIIPPQGYTNPKFYAASLSSCALMWERPELNLLPHITCALTAAFQTKMMVPTYFVRSEFAQAVANTRLPMDFKLTELHWPLDAMLFVLPDAFVRSYFKFFTPFLAISRCPKGCYPTIEQIGYAHDKKWEISRFSPVMNEVDRMLVHYPCYFGKELPCDYSGSWPLKLDLSTIRAAEFVDATIYEASLHPHIEPPTPIDAPTPEQEKELQDKMTLFAVKLMLAFTARPHLIRNGGRARAAKIKRGVVIRDELWNPNLVGWDYVVQRSRGGLGLGTHASPRIHWRPGHFTHQFIGKRGDPNFVPAASLPRKETDGSIDWDKVEPAVQESFWKNHKLMWVDPVLVDVLNEKDEPNKA